MKDRWQWVAGVLAFLAVTAPGARAAEGLVYEVPRVDGVRIDGKGDDWGDGGFRVEVIQALDGSIRPTEDLDPRFRLGWDERGLLVLVVVRDDSPYERNPYAWDNDSLELFVAAKRGAPQFYQVILTPGRDPEKPEPGRQLEDHRPSSSSRAPLAVETARTKSADGYTLEALLPWRNLGLQPRAGHEVAFQLYVNDSDGAGDRYQLAWHPKNRTHENSNNMHRLRLAARPSPAVHAAASGAYERLRRTRVRVNAVAADAGKPVEVRDGRKSLAKGRLVADAGRAAASLILPMPARGEAEGELTVLVGGEPVASLTLPSADEQRARALMEAELHFQPFVFTGAGFPPVEFAEPSRAEDLIGPYTIKTTFYDRDYNPVTKAEKPGRYGAVIEIVPEQGRPIRRYRTLFRAVEEYSWWSSPVPASIALPRSMGIEPGALEAHRQAVSDYLNRHFFDDSVRRDPRSAQLLAGLYETKPGSPAPRKAEDVWAMDRQWWVGLKRKLSGTDRRYSQAFVSPRPVNGQHAPELREGTAAEAGMKPDAVEKIDAVCRAWAGDSDGGFAVCLARHGKVFLHRAYGQRDGRPMSLTDKSWMASISKLLAGTQLLMLVDQGLISLDDPVDKHLPAFKGIKVQKPLTVRHLFTHTNGLWGHWGDDLHDFEEVVAGYYPYLEVGERYEYNGAGFALAGKIIETVTGEAMPQFAARHLFDPLGCTHTDQLSMAAATDSTPMDMARIAQMLLNRGAYGPHRFFSEATFENLLPRPLSETINPKISVVYGLGSGFFEGEGLGKGTYGHGAASAATLRIDPENDLVVVMTRNAAGKNFQKYHSTWLKTIAEGIGKGK